MKAGVTVFLNLHSALSELQILLILKVMFMNRFFALNTYRRIQLQFATNRIKIGPFKPEIQPGKKAYYVKGLPPVTLWFVNFLKFHFDCGNTSEWHTRHFNTLVPYRCCKRKIFIIYSSSVSTMVSWLPTNIPLL